MFIEIIREAAPFYEVRQHKIKGKWIIRSSHGNVYLADNFESAIQQMDDDARAFKRRMETG